MEERKGETIEFKSENGGGKKVSVRLLFLKTVFHLAALIHHYIAFGFGIYIYLTVTEEQLKVPLIRLAKTYFLGFFTIWNFSFQTTFLCLALAYDVLQWLDKDDSRIGKRIRYLRDIVFNGLVFPFTCFVNIMFWTLYWIDRELVFPQVYDQILPWWLNHCVHTNIMVVIIVETILTSRRYPTDVVVERIFYVFINISYAVVFYSIRFFAGCWLYGVFGIMNWWQVCLYQCGISLSSYVFYHMAFFFNRLVHGPESLEEICAKVKTSGDVESKDVTFGSELKTTGGEMQIAFVGKTEIADDPKQLRDNFAEAKENGSNGDTINADNGKVNQNGLNGDENELTLNGDNVKVNQNGTNGEENGLTLNEGNEVKQNEQNGNENGKDWRSIENGGEVDANGTFDKSWSTKYRTSRNQFENSSL